MLVDWRIVEEAIREANKLGRTGVRVKAADYMFAETATQNDMVILHRDDSPQSATDSD